MTRYVCELLDLGRRDYNDVWQLQKTLIEERARGRISNDQLILVEHPDVLTIGRGGRAENIPMRERLSVPIYEIERGGDVTYHGPGQLVGYPILSLQTRGLDVKSYVVGLETTIVEALKSFGVQAEGRLGKETGVWVGRLKVASIGVAVSKWVTYHGFALNVNTDLKKFNLIRPCGFDSSVMTSMQFLLGGNPIDFEEVKTKTVETFARVFDSEMKRAIPISQTTEEIPKVEQF